MPGLVDRSVVEVLRVQLVADVLRHRLGADIDANQWCSLFSKTESLIVADAVVFFQSRGFGWAKAIVSSTAIIQYGEND